MTAVDLKAIRERVKELEGRPSLQELLIVTDRAQLLALVDRMRKYLRHVDLCVKDTYRDWPCRCDLDALLEELGR